MIRWIFFDVGNVLLNEDPLSFQVFLRHVEAITRRHPDQTFTELLAEREAKACAGSRWPVFDMASRYLDTDQLSAIWNETDREIRAGYGELSPLIPGAREVIAEFGTRYCLGLIANQPREARALLDSLSLIDAFQVIVLSEEVGLFKPDPAIFRHALGSANAASAECLMVGDRLDNDIRPAQALGIRTAWIRWRKSSAKGWITTDERANAYLDSLERVRRSLDSRVEPTPDLTLDEVRQLPEMLVMLRSIAEC